MQGHLRASEAVLQDGFEFLQQKGLELTPLRNVFYTTLAWIFYQRNDIENTLKYAGTATGYAEHVGFVRDIVEGNLLLSLSHKASGKIRESEDCLRKIRLVTERQGIAAAGLSTESWLARLWMSEDNLRWAAEWCRRRNPSLDEPFSGLLIRDCMTGVELLIREKRYRKAEVILVRLRQVCVDRRMMEAVLDIDIAYSAALYAEKRQERAAEVMEGALSFAESEGYIRPFLDYAPMIFPLLSDMKAADLSLRQFLHLKTIMAACTVDGKGLVGTTTRFRKDRSKGLTEREIEILRLMAAGFRYREIATKMFISFETVKTHVKHVFGKLEVKTGTQAVRRAQDLRLLD